jgi:hypothetical protein
MLHNVVDMTNVLAALQQGGVCVTPEAASSSPWTRLANKSCATSCTVVPSAFSSPVRSPRSSIKDLQ